MVDFARARAAMVDGQLVPRGIRDPRVLDAMRSVPRERFVPSQQVDYAYQDRPLPIGDGQTISQPYIVAFMAEAASVGPDDRVLEIGTGSGYGAAVLGALAASVVTVERRGSLAASARRVLAGLGYRNVEVVLGDGTLGSPDRAPFDVIIVTAAGPDVPGPLRDQLAVGGRIVMPVEYRYGFQQLVRLERVSEDEFTEVFLLGVAFVPLIGEHGHSDG